MAQQVFNQWAPVAKAQNEQGQEVYLPFAGIHAQTRDGNDEIIVGAGNMVWTGSMWVPVSDQNRLPVEATLSGQIPSGSNTIGKVAIDRNESSPVVTHPRQILTSSVFNLITVPAGAVGVKVETVIHGVTGTFGDGQGVRTDVFGYGRRLSSSVIEVSTQRTRQSGRSHFIWWYPGIDEEINFDIRTGNALRIVNSLLPPRINFRIDITGTFEDGQGVDCEQFIEWLF